MLPERPVLATVSRSWLKIAPPSPRTPTRPHCRLAALADAVVAVLSRKKQFVTVTVAPLLAKRPPPSPETYAAPSAVTEPELAVFPETVSSKSDRGPAV